MTQTPAGYDPVKEVSSYLAVGTDLQENSRGGGAEYFMAANTIAEKHNLPDLALKAQALLAEAIGIKPSALELKTDPISSA